MCISEQKQATFDEDGLHSTAEKTFVYFRNKHELLLTKTSSAVLQKKHLCISEQKAATFDENGLPQYCGQKPPSPFLAALRDCTHTLKTKAPPIHTQYAKMVVRSTAEDPLVDQVSSCLQQF